MGTLASVWVDLQCVPVQSYTCQRANACPSSELFVVALIVSLLLLPHLPLTRSCVTGSICLQILLAISILLLQP